MVDVIIKVPKKVWNTIERNGEVEWCGIEMADAVKNGIPLPKGHGDLVDRNELLKHPIDNANYPSNYVRIAPTIIEADKE